MSSGVFERGYWNVARVRGVPVRLHWSVGLGALLFGGLRFVPVFWLAFVLLVLVHELGHAWLVRRLGHRALAVDVTGFGGLCHWDPRGATALDHYLIAWGGVGAQLLLLMLALAYWAVAGPPSSTVEAQLLSAFTTTNLWLIVLNLVPVPPLDGAQAWKLFGELKRRRVTPWNLLQRWAAGRKQRRPDPTTAGKKASPPAEQHQPGNGPSKASQAEMARLFEQIAEEARRAREQRK